MQEQILSDSKQIVVNVSEGVQEVIIREGIAPELLPIKPAVKIELSGTIGAPLEFLKKRVSEPEQINQKQCHVIVDREQLSITLITNESNPYLRGEVTGALQVHPKFEEFGINSNKVWSPSQLGLFFKMNRAFFPDRKTNMELVNKLMNFEASVNSKIERSVKETGSNTDNYSQVVNSNLPEVFTLKIPIFKGGQTEQIEVETFARVSGREVAFVLISPGANQTLEEIKDTIIDANIANILNVCPEIAIIEV